jgi:redox-sensing transcriptional repressor
MNKKKVPQGTISRLFEYLRELKNLSIINIRTISSSELGERLNLSDAQIRKDLGYFGSFGTSGAGYNIEELKKALEKILGKDRAWNICIVGIGHLGSALLEYPGFKNHNLHITAAFDSDPKKIGRIVDNIIIESTEKIKPVVSNKRISIAIITTPVSVAQKVANDLIASGIECIMNFTPVKLDVPEKIKVEDVDLSHVLENLTYFVNNEK